MSGINLDVSPVLRSSPAQGLGHLGAAMEELAVRDRKMRIAGEVLAFDNWGNQRTNEVLDDLQRTNFLELDESKVRQFHEELDKRVAATQDAETQLVMSKVAGQLKAHTQKAYQDIYRGKQADYSHGQFIELKAQTIKDLKDETDPDERQFKIDKVMSAADLLKDAGVHETVVESHKADFQRAIDEDFEKKLKSTKIDAAYGALYTEFAGDFAAMSKALADPAKVKALGLDITEAHTVQGIVNGNFAFEQTSELKAKQQKDQVDINDVFGLVNAGKINSAYKTLANSGLDEDKKFQIGQIIKNSLKVPENDPRLKAAKEWAKIQLLHAIRTEEITSEDQILQLAAKLGLPHSDYKEAVKDLDDVNNTRGQVNYYENAVRIIENKIGYDPTKDKTDYDKNITRSKYLTTFAEYMKIGKYKRNDPALLKLAEKLTEGTETYGWNPWQFGGTWTGGKGVLEKVVDTGTFISPNDLNFKLPERTVR